MSVIGVHVGEGGCVCVRCRSVCVRCRSVCVREKHS